MPEPLGDVLPEPEFGAFVVSLDFEMHWGVRDHFGAEGPYRENLLGERRAIPRILDLFDEYGVSATWATVGMLFADSRDELEAYFPAERPGYRDPRLSPYQEPVGADEDEDPIHFAPSLIELIRRSPGQEIGTHTFSHYYTLEPGQTEETFKADLASAVTIARDKGVDLRSLVLPRNQYNPNYAEVLLDTGIGCYRGNQAGWMHGSAGLGPSNPVARGARLLDSYVSTGSPYLTGWGDLIEPNGLCNVPASRFLRPYSPRLTGLDRRRLRRIELAMREAARSRRIFHVWWHPHNFGRFTDENLDFLRQVLEVFKSEREMHGMRSLSMGQVAELARPSRAA